MKMPLNRDNRDDPIPSGKESPRLPDSLNRPRASWWNWVAIALLLPLAAYGAYALTRDLQREKASVQVVGSPAPPSNVPRPNPEQSSEPPVAEI
ncbi:MAG: hypothetical protein ACREHD_15175, partial [Pirellulales bacterium]